MSAGGVCHYCQKWECACDDGQKDVKPDPICAEHSHEYKPLRDGYYKPTGRKNAFGPTYDHSVSYHRLYCSRCGSTLEVIEHDHRRAAEEK